VRRQVRDERKTLVAAVPGSRPRPTGDGSVLDRVRSQAPGPLAVEASSHATPAMVRTVFAGRVRRDGRGRGCDRVRG